jgi:uncharacterized protein (TIGR03066 family)
MKLRLPVLAGMVILGMSMVAVAGSDNAMKLIGVWEVTKSDSGAPKGTTVEFTKDGKMIMKAKFMDKELVINGTYKVKGDTVTAIFSEGGKTKEDPATIKKLTDKELIVVDGKGKIDEYKRVK